MVMDTPPPPSLFIVGFGGGGNPSETNSMESINQSIPFGSHGDKLFRGCGVNTWKAKKKKERKEKKRKLMKAPRLMYVCACVHGQCSSVCVFMCAWAVYNNIKRK